MKSAVLVIDVQAGLFLKQDLPAEAKEVVSRINEITRKARAASVPVIFVQHEAPDSALSYGTDGWQLQEDLESEANDLKICKTTPDSFMNTGLEAKLRSLRVDNLIVCGYASEFCVDTTVRRGAGLGFSITLVADAHTTHDKKHFSGIAIRDHENETLSHITSFGVSISAVPSTEISF
ncbi:MAG: nicotinamidase-related amidase [Desulforhopalus sp.]|jgi:nicotinamidase-related amidase